MVFPSPIKSVPYVIEGQWIDYNGHFNMAYYNVLFDRDSDVALDLVGLGPAYVEKTGNSYFTLEAHVSYLRELAVTDQVTIATQILDLIQSVSIMSRRCATPPKTGSPVSMKS